MSPVEQHIIWKRWEASAICKPRSFTHFYYAHTVLLLWMIPVRLAGMVRCGPENKQRICRSKTLCVVFNEVQKVMEQKKHAIKE